MFDILLFLFNPNNTVVSLLVCLIILTLIAFVIPNGSSNSPDGYNSVSKAYCLFVSMVPLLWSVYLWSIFDASGHTLQMVVTLDRLHLSFGVDSVSLSLTLLSAGLFPICIMLMRTVKGYLTFLLLEVVIYGALNVLDLLGFYVLFEASLILLFLLIGRTHYGNIEAAYKIILYFKRTSDWLCKPSWPTLYGTSAWAISFIAGASLLILSSQIAACNPLTVSYRGMMYR